MYDFGLARLILLVSPRIGGVDASTDRVLLLRVD